MTRCRRSFSITGGDVGLGHGGVRRGDAIVLFYGGSTHSEKVRRRIAGQIVGESYIHGLMHGEAMEERHRQGRLDEDFILE